MSESGEFLEKIGANKQFRDAVGTAEKIIGPLSKMIGPYAEAYGAAKSALATFGLIKAEADQITELHQEIKELRDLVNAKFAEVLRAIAKQGDEQRIRDVETQLAGARTALNLLLEFPPDNPEFEKRKLPADSQSLTALMTLLEPSYWERPYYQPWVYVGAWAGMLPPHTKPEPTGELVFEYRHTLPAYLEALALRITIAGLIGLNYANHQPPFKKIAAFLFDKYDTIFQGIVSLRPPNENEIAPYYSEGTQPFMTTKYYRQEAIWSGREYGAVETYSATSCTDMFPQYFVPELPKAPEPIKIGEAPWEIQNPEQFKIKQEMQRQYNLKLQQFTQAMETYKSNVKAIHRYLMPRLALQTLRKRKQVYAVVGLPALWRIINHLRVLAGDEPLGLCDLSAWSLREFDDVIRQATGAPPATQAVSLREVSSKLPGFGISGNPINFSLLGLMDR